VDVWPTVHSGFGILQEAEASPIAEATRPRVSRCFAKFMVRRSLLRK